MKTIIDITGNKYGRLTAIKESYKTKSDTYWLCKCDCGNYKNVRKCNLTGNVTFSCGCLQKEAVSKVLKTHGKSKTKIYKVWASMNQRCTNESYSEYKCYGGKGISVCNDWKKFENFYKWAIENGYKESCEKYSISIDRINTNENYCPENCRFVNYKIQGRNKTNNHLININGNIKPLSEWCEIYNINSSTVRNRIARGWGEIKALTSPVETKYNWRC